MRLWQPVWKVPKFRDRHEMLRQEKWEARPAFAAPATAILFVLFRSVGKRLAHLPSPPFCSAFHLRRLHEVFSDEMAISHPTVRAILASRVIPSQSPIIQPLMERRRTTEPVFSAVGCATPRFSCRISASWRLYYNRGWFSWSNPRRAIQCRDY
jgi:hypothetical protein